MKLSITPSYTFTPASRQIDFTGILSFSVAKLYAVINVTRNQLIYAVGQPRYGYTTSAGSLVTFVYDTAAMSSGDVLTIIYDQNGVFDLPTGASTSALQTTGNASLTSIDGKLPPLGQALAAASVPVVLPAAQLSSLVGSLGPVTPGTVAGNSSLIGGQYNFTAPILQSGQQAALQTNYRGELLVAQSLNAPTTDAANRLRVSELVQTLGYTFALSDHQLSFNSSTATGGTVTHVPGSALTRLAVTTASGSQAIFQTRRYLRYTPGVSHMINISTVVGAAKTNVTKRWGFFDALDGKFFQQDGSNLAVVVRSSTSGSAVDTVINQSSWNIDKLNGTGPSGLTLDVTKDNLYIIDFSWHGAARVRFGLLLNGIKVYCHEYIGSNIFTVPYTRSPFLPIRSEITNTATTASITSFDLVACSGFKESSEPYMPAYNFARSTARAFKNANLTAAPFISIRPRTTFDGITNRIAVAPTQIQILAGGVAVVVLLVLNPTLTGAVFADVDTTYSATQVDTTALTYTGGTVIGEFFAQANSSQSFDLTDFSDAILLGLNVAGTTADILTVVLQSTAGNSSSGAVIRWGEYQ